MMKKVLLMAVGFISLSFLGPVSLRCGQVHVIRMHHRDAHELLPVVNTLLSDGGKVSVDRTTNSIVVKDAPDVLENIRMTVEALDRAPEQLNIRFLLQEGSHTHRKKVSVSAKASGEHWSVQSGKQEKDGVHIKGQDVKQRAQQGIESFVTVLSGNSAYIAMGKKIPYTTRWAYFSERYGYVGETVELEHVETGFEVRPTVFGSNVRVEITPRVSREDGHIIRFTEASTTLVVSRGKWVSLSGARQETNEVIREILSKGSETGHAALSFWLLVEP